MDGSFRYHADTNILPLLPGVTALILACKAFGRFPPDFITDLYDHIQKHAPPTPSSLPGGLTIRSKKDRDPTQGKKEEEEPFQDGDGPRVS